MLDQPFLSVIIPAFNEANLDRLPNTLSELIAFIQKQDFLTEVVIVNNNSSDCTFEIAEAASLQYSFIRVVNEPIQGKGAAVKTGAFASHGKYLFICDADLSMPINEILKFIPPHIAEYEIAIASREVPGSQRMGEPEFRHIMGRVFNFIVRLIAVRGLKDTQCGFKCFPRDIAMSIFPLQTINGWAFDVELLFIAQQKGFQITEIPITWVYKEQSKIKPLKDAYSMILETLRIRQNDFLGVYKTR